MAGYSTLALAGPYPIINQNSNFLPISNATVDLPDGSTHHVTGIGTIRLPINNDFIELKNVQYIPGLKAQLLSFDQLEEQGFDIQLTNDKP